MLVPASTRGDLLMAGRPDVIGGHYHVGKRIGEGSFGVIYEGFNDLNEKRVAMKFEPWKSTSPQLKDEYRTYKVLSGCPGIPTIYYFGQETGFNCLVMELLGPSLEEVFDKCGRKFSVGTVCLLAIEMISRIQTVHEKGMIYRDIKPDNFLVGSHDSTVYIVDFGMAKYYVNQITGKHIPYSEKKSLSGTARYMSINTHRGREQSRRDDLEALGHVFLYFLRGSLPWQGIKANTNKEKYEKIGDKKQRVPVNELCAGFPEEFARYLGYARGLGFEDRPNYEYIKGLFRGLLAKLGPEEGTFDWLRKGIELERPVSKVPELEDGNEPDEPNEPILASSNPRSPLRSPRQEASRPLQSTFASTKPEHFHPAAPQAAHDAEPRRKASLWRRLFCI